MSDDFSHPLLRVRARWDRNQDNPQLQIGAFGRGIEERYTTAEMGLPNTMLYQTATNFCIWVSRQPALHYRLQFNRNYFYSDITSARRDHYRLTQPVERVPERRIEDPDRFDYYATQYERRRAAEKKAEGLLTDQTDPQFAANVIEGKCFYFRPTPDSPWYIIDPWSKNVIRLDLAHPTGLCILFADHEVQSNKFDWAVGIYLYLKGASEYLHETANEYRMLRYSQWHQDEPVKFNSHEQGLMNYATSSEGLLNF